MSHQIELGEAPTAFTRARTRDWDQLRRMLVVGYVMAAVTSWIAVAFIGTDHGNWWLLGGGVAELALGVVLAFTRPSEVWIRLLGIYAPIAFISFGVAVARPTGPAMIYFVWPALVCGHYGTRRDGLLSTLLMWSTFATALAVGNRVQVPLLTFLSITSIFGVVLIAYRLQRMRTDELTLDLAHAASTDGLTGLLNRRAFMDAFEREVSRAQSAGLPLTLIVFDLDHFKEINDRHGHAAGDDALRAFADVLRAECRPGDLVSRLGGEEFAVVLFDSDTHRAERAAQRIASSLAHWGHSGLQTRLTTSAGVATLGAHGTGTDELLIAADRALYVAKEQGRNRFAASGGDGAREFAAVA